MLRMVLAAAFRGPGYGYISLFQPRGDFLKSTRPPCRMIFWVTLSLTLAGFSFQGQEPIDQIV